jgi:hypothetical protein
MERSSISPRLSSRGSSSFMLDPCRVGCLRHQRRCSNGRIGSGTAKAASATQISRLNLKDDSGIVGQSGRFEHPRRAHALHSLCTAVRLPGSRRLVRAGADRYVARHSSWHRNHSRCWRHRGLVVDHPGSFGGGCRDLVLHERSIRARLIRPVPMCLCTTRYTSQVRWADDMVLVSCCLLRLQRCGG